MANAEVTDGVPARLYYSIAEVAGLFSVSTKTVKRLISRGELRGVKIGSRRVIPGAEVNRLQAEVEAGNGAKWTRD
jgi:excisionase family DNA binding protein